MRLSVSLFAFVLVSTVIGLSPEASAQPTDLWLEESPYTHQDDLFVVGETLTIHIEGPVDDIYDVTIVYDPFGITALKREWDDRVVPSGGEIVLQYDIPLSASSNEMYQVQVWDESRTFMYLTYNYWLILFRADIEVARMSYLAGETVDLQYVCWYVQDNSLVTNGHIDWVVLDPWNVQIVSDEKTIASPQDAIGTFSFGLPPGSLPGWYDVMLWLNDTAGGTPDHVTFAGDSFRVDSLSVSTIVDEPIYAPGESVRVDVRVRIGAPGVAGADVDIIVRENGIIAPQYGIDNLITPMDGEVTHFFTLDSATPDSTDFEIEAVATLVAVTVSANDTFVVQAVPVGDFDVTLRLDKTVYLSGDTVTATALTQASGTTTDANYMFSVLTSLGTPLYMSAQNTSVFQFQAPDDYQGWLGIYVTAKNSEGYEDNDMETADVHYGLLLVDADKKEYEAGDDIIVSFELASNVMASPTFYYTVETAGLPLESGPAGTDNFTFHVPPIPANWYDFRVIAIDGGRVAEGGDSASILSGFLISLDFDKEAYMPGETMTIDYAVEARGISTLPGVYYMTYGLMNLPLHSKQTFAANGTLTYPIPQGVDEGHQLFAVLESATMTFTYEVVRIGNVTVPPEQNITRLQLQLDNLQSNLSSIQALLWDIWDQLNASTSEVSSLRATLWDVWDELNVTTSRLDELENRIEELEAELADLEERQAATKSAGADNAVIYLALMFGIAGLVVGIAAMMRKPPRSTLSEQQPTEEGAPEEQPEPETY
ncbi:MAG: hypothetical protein KAU99_06255 [Thermoplasmata archaeon]|nr:hypothetical protein [Thermoplasmata archaeon]